MEDLFLHFFDGFLSVLFFLIISVFLSSSYGSCSSHLGADHPQSGVYVRGDCSCGRVSIMSGSPHASKPAVREGMGYLGSVASATIAGVTVGKLPLQLSERYLPGRPIFQLCVAAPFCAFIVISAAGLGRGLCEGVVEGVSAFQNSRSRPSPSTDPS